MANRLFVRCVGHTGPLESLVVPLRDGATVKELLKAIRHRATFSDGLEALYFENDVVYPGNRLHSTDICGRVGHSVVVNGDKLVAAPAERPWRRSRSRTRERWPSFAEPRDPGI